LAGSAGGLAGGWLGTWLPAQLAPTRGERDYLLRLGRRMLLVSVLFVALLLVPLLAFAGQLSAAFVMIFLAVWFVAYGAYVGVECANAVRGVKRLRAQGPAEPNDTPLRAGLARMAGRRRGRVYRSRATLLGLPLIDVNVSDPVPPGGPGAGGGGPRVARGWIAVGDDARGVLLAVGNKARGLVAVGGRTVGALSCGGVAFGVVAFGGLAVGMLAVGGLGLGVLGIGGLGVGWQACGGGAVAWDVACGGAAVAYHAAFGGGAVAHDYAVGGGAWAEHANDAAAKAVLLDHPLKQGMDWYIAHTGWVTAGLVAFAVLLPAALLLLMYHRTRDG
jgi:hypothetical protein